MTAVWQTCVSPTIKVAEHLLRFSRDGAKTPGKSWITNSDQMLANVLDSWIACFPINAFVYCRRTYGAIWLAEDPAPSGADDGLLLLCPIIEMREPNVYFMCQITRW
jgi:hypothetical protein